MSGIRSLRSLAAVAASLVVTFSLSACAAANQNDAAQPPFDGNNPGPFAAVNASASAAFEAEGIEGMGLAIYSREGVKVFEQMYGEFEPNRRVPIASASKIVSGVTIFRLIDAGQLSLDSTTGETLGWTSDKGAITLRQLLSFTSGLPPENRCTYRSELTLEDCVNEIAEVGLMTEPATEFDYGSTHLSVAGRMAEVVTGKAWSEIFAEQTLSTLGLPSDIAYISNPLRPAPTANPLLAGGLIVSMNDYEPLLHMIFDKGQWQGRQLITSQLFDEQAREPYPGVTVGQSPWSERRYGLTAWLECDTPATGCTSISSPGAFGFTPFIDRDAGYYAILGMNYLNNSASGFGARTEQQLKPLIAAAMEQL